MTSVVPWNETTLATIQMEPTRWLSRAIISLLRAAHLARWADRKKRLAS
jgi:hypothetical protein